MPLFAVIHQNYADGDDEIYAIGPFPTIEAARRWARIDAEEKCGAGRHLGDIDNSDNENVFELGDGEQFWRIEQLIEPVAGA